MEPIFGKDAVSWDTDWNWMIDVLEREEAGRGQRPAGVVTEAVRSMWAGIEAHCRDPAKRDNLKKYWTTRRFLVRPEGYTRVRNSLHRLTSLTSPSPHS